jgi:hypothetical protein
MRTATWAIAAALLVPCVALAAQPDCSEATIRAFAPPDAVPMLDRAFDWVHRGVPYCQCVSGNGGPYRTDCSGFVSMVWELPAPGHSTYSFAGGPWDDGASHLIGVDELLIGDAVRRMLPKNRLSRVMMKKLHVTRDETLPQHLQGKNPVKLTVL